MVAFEAAVRLLNPLEPMAIAWDGAREKLVVSAQIACVKLVECVA
jgi:hypothetical protein